MSKPILSPAQVEMCIEAMPGWELSGCRGWHTPYGWVPHIYESDGRFLFPLETLLKRKSWEIRLHSFYSTHGTPETWAAFQECDRDLFDKYLRADSHEAAVLQAALVELCGEREG